MKKLVFKNGRFVTSFDMHEPIENHPEYKQSDVSIWYAPLGSIKFKKVETRVFNTSTCKDTVRYNNTAEVSDIPTDVALQSIRYRRSQLLSECDWTTAADAPFTKEVKQAWTKYRQELRDLPTTFAENPTSVKWPTPPGK